MLAMYGSGRTTGVTVDYGASVSHTVPVHEGYAMPHAIRRTNLGDRDLTDYLCKILTESNERTTAERIKEELCYVSLDFAEEVDNFTCKESEYEMPDMTTVTVHNQIIRCPELLFSPIHDGKEILGIHELAREIVSDCDADLPKYLYQTSC